MAMSDLTVVEDWDLDDIIEDIDDAICGSVQGVQVVRARQHLPQERGSVSSIPRAALGEDRPLVRRVR